ncbi:MAG: PHP domain-containing protein [Promethearchaeota archaeon]
MKFPKINLHIHSIYSDGRNTIQQIVEKSLKLGLEYIAITDHFTNSWKANIIPTLNNSEKISNYLEEITNYQKLLREKDSNLTLYKGIEIDISSSEKFIKSLIQPDKFDLILFEYLQSYESIAFIKNIIAYWKNKVKPERKIPILGLAHFDPFYFIHGNLEIIIQFLENNNIYFEFNSSYPQCYSSRNLIFFEKIKQYNIPVAIGSDSHNLLNLVNIEEPLQMIKYYNLEANFNNLISTLKTINR